MRIFISGGAKNGKSFLAQRIASSLAGGGPLYYVATMDACDDEDRARIKRHIAERDGWGFETLECPYCADLETRGGRGSYLFDSVTALLSNEMFGKGDYDASAGKRVAEALGRFAERCENIVIVSDYIYSDAFVYDEMTESYRRALAHADRYLASVCDSVYEVCASTVTVHKGEEVPL